MEMNIQNYEYLYQFLKIDQNCLNNTYTCPQKSAQNCSNLFKSTYICPKKNAQKCSKNCSKLLKIV